MTESEITIAEIEYALGAAANEVVQNWKKPLNQLKSENFDAAFQKVFKDFKEISSVIDPNKLDSSISLTTKYELWQPIRNQFENKYLHVVSGISSELQKIYNDSELWGKQRQKQIENLKNNILNFQDYALTNVKERSDNLLSTLFDIINNKLANNTPVSKERKNNIQTTIEDFFGTNELGLQNREEVRASLSISGNPELRLFKQSWNKHTLTERKIEQKRKEKLAAFLGIFYLVYPLFTLLQMILWTITLRKQKRTWTFKANLVLMYLFTIFDAVALILTIKQINDGDKSTLTKVSVFFRIVTLMINFGFTVYFTKYQNYKKHLTMFKLYFGVLWLQLIHFMLMIWIGRNYVRELGSA